jgi:hypothetical protein
VLEPPESEVLIGVDGGATEVRAHEVTVLGGSDGLSLRLGPASASCLYDRARGFRPRPMPSQLLDFERQRIEPGGLEGAQGRLWLEAVSRAILGVAEQTGKARARLGVCMPGLKTSDGKGMAVVRRGPRIPAFLDRLEAMLAEGGLALARPVTRLSSDGEAGAFGESVEPRGLLRDVDTAYYLGGGTGLAEALKIEGRIRSFDSMRGFVRKAWQMEANGGRNVEDLVSPGGMNAAYAAHSGKRLPLDRADHPERRALEGDEHATVVLRDVAEGLAELALDRMMDLRRGALDRQEPAARGSSRDPGPRIAPNTFLDRIVVGQRLGAMLADPELRSVLRDPAEEALARRIVATGDGALRKHYLDGSRLRQDLIAPSLLRASPALGAAAIEILGESGSAIPRESASKKTV